MSQASKRPLSPHLTIYRWGPHMTVSILHRITGGALTVAGLFVLTWWLLALAEGGRAYEKFQTAATHPLGMVVLVGLSWAFFQHLLSGLRHLILDMGAGYDLKVNKFWSVMTMVGSALLTAIFWWLIMGVGA